MSRTERGLVAPSDIAEMAGVTRAAVSNWRKRMPDFPEPAGGTTAKPLFDRADVAAWLRSRGKEPRQDRGEGSVWAVLNEFRSSWSVDQMADAALTLACVRKLSTESTRLMPPWVSLHTAHPGSELSTLEQIVREEAHVDPLWTSIASGVPALDATDPLELRRLIEVLDHVDVEDLPVVVDYALARLAAMQMRLAGTHGSAESKVSILLGRLAARHATSGAGIAYDPACGIGSALVVAASAGLRAARFVGHDIDAATIRRASQRALLHRLRLETKTADVLAHDPDPDLRADVIVLEPPFGLNWGGSELADPRWRFGLPPRSSADMAWVQHAVSHLADEGRAYVITPMGPLFRAGPERAIRTELIRAGCVETIVALPSKLVPYTSIPLALWVLRPAAETSADLDVRFFDGTNFGDIEDVAPAWCDGSTEWDVNEVPNRCVPASEILTAGGDLTPQRWTDVSLEARSEIATVYSEGWQAMTSALRKVAGSGGTLVHFANAPQSRVLTVGELIEQGVLELRSGKRYTDLPPDVQRRVATPADVRDGALVMHSDDETSALRQHYPELTMEGDVLVTTMNHVRTLVDEYGGHLPSNGVYRLRILDHNQVAVDFLAAVLEGSWNQRFQVGTTIQRASIRALEVPVVSPHDQQNFTLALLAVERLQEHARDLLEHTQTVENSLLDALRYNVKLDEP